jgi:hypothetical protein
MRRLTSLVLCLLLSGCSSDDPAGGPGQKKEAVAFHFETDVAPGEEIEKCQFVAMPADKGPLSVGRMFHEYSAGSHHFLIYRTERTTIPAGGDALIDCDEAGWMQEVRGVVYAAQDTKGSFEVPDGVGQNFLPGEVLLVQTHYLNTQQQELRAVIDVDFELVDAADVTTEAGVLFFYNPSIVLPPNA